MPEGQVRDALQQVQGLIGVVQILLAECENMWSLWARFLQSWLENLKRWEQALLNWLAWYENRRKNSDDNEDPQSESDAEDDPGNADEGIGDGMDDGGGNAPSHLVIVLKRKKSGRGGDAPETYVTITLSDGTEFSAWVRSNDELEAFVQRIVDTHGRAHMIEIIGHGCPGAQFISEEDILFGLNVRVIFDGAFEPDGRLILYGCNVADEPGGPVYLNDLARNTGVSVTGNTGKTYYISLPGGRGPWIIWRAGDEVTATPP